jgi:hypothetical protein
MTCPYAASRIQRGIDMVNRSGSIGSPGTSYADIVGDPSVQATDPGYAGSSDVAGALTAPAPVAAQPALAISGTVAGQATSDVATIMPFSNVALTDTGSGQGDTVDLFLDAANGILINNSNSGFVQGNPGYWYMTGTPAAIQASLRSLVFMPTVHAAATGQPVTTGFQITLSNASGSQVTDTTASVVATTSGGPASSAGIDAAYATLTQASPTAQYDSTTAAQIDTSALTTGAWIASLLTNAQVNWLMLAGLVEVDAFYNVTPSSDIITTLAQYDTGLNTLHYAPADMWNILGLEFAHNGTFGTTYGSMDNLAYANAIYQFVFGTTAPAAVAQQLASEVVPMASAYASFATDTLGGKGAVLGALLYYAETTKLGKFYGPANAFLTSEMTIALTSGTQATYAQGTELRQQFPNASALPPAAISDATIVSASGVSTDPGTGTPAIQFIAGTSNDSVVLHTGSTVTIAGFDPGAGDMLDFHALLSEAQVSVTDVSQLAAHLAVVQQGADALLTFRASGQPSAAVAVLQGLGGSVQSVADLARQNALAV